jgi:4'-phosphopantetheinyl transferase
VGDVEHVLVTAEEVPGGDDWLGPREREALEPLRGPRRASWRLGRYAAKRLLGAGVEVLASGGGAPRGFRGDAPIDRWISISHRGGVGLAAAAPFPIGCDLELVEPRSAAFLAEYFTAAEQRAASADPAVVANLLWSAKESALKALGVGLTRDTRELEVTIDGTRLDVRAGGLVLRGEWRRAGDVLLTFVWPAAKRRAAAAALG